MLPEYSGTGKTVKHQFICYCGNRKEFVSLLVGFGFVFFFSSLFWTMPSLLPLLRALRVLLGIAQFGLFATRRAGSSLLLHIIL